MMGEASRVEQGIIVAGVCAGRPDLLTERLALSIFKYLSIVPLRYHRSGGSNTTTGDIRCSSQ